MTTSKPLVDVGGRALARHTAYNVIGQALPLAVGLAAIPVAARYLGDVRFGVLGLVWALMGYFGLLDLGLGRATTKHVAACLARGDFATGRQLATLSVLVQAGLGVFGAGILALLTPWLVSRAMLVPAALQPEVRAAFYLVAASIPLVSVSAALRAILEAAQRFDLVNLVRTPTSAALFAVPAVVAALGHDLVAIVLWLLVVRLLAMGAWTWIVPRAVAGYRWRVELRWTLFRPLLSYGAWAAVSSAVSPLLGYLERFLLASVVGLAAVGYYTGPAEAVMRLLIVPAALAGALFPAVSAADGIGGAQAMGERLAATSLRYLAAILEIGRAHV